MPFPNDRHPAAAVVVANEEQASAFGCQVSSSERPSLGASCSAALRRKDPIADVRAALPASQLRTLVHVDVPTAFGELAQPLRCLEAGGLLSVRFRGGTPL